MKPIEKHKRNNKNYIEKQQKKKTTENNITTIEQHQKSIRKTKRKTI